MECERIVADWNVPVIVVASGPSLNPQIAWTCRKKRWFDGWRIVVINDAYKFFVHADILYGCDAKWWETHGGAPEFTGEKWSSHSEPKDAANDKREAANRFGLRCVYGYHRPGFSRDPSCIHYGSNSGFQAVNIAIHKGATKIVLVGFDMRVSGDGRNHFFGDHPKPLQHNTNYKGFIQQFQQACPPPVPIINATPGSALKCFPMKPLEEALQDDMEGLYANAKVG